MKNIFLLDMDETLLDFCRGEQENFFATMKRFGLPANDEMYHRFHKINDDLWKLLERGGIARERLKERRFEQLFEEYGISANTQDVAREYFENFCNICCPFEGATDFLQALRARGRTYIVTNGSARIQRRHIQDAGFAPLVADVFISEEVGANKPSKEYADHVKAHVPDFETARAIWIGDSLTSDMVCANNAGVDFILYCPKGVPEGYRGAFARSYTEILKLIEM